MIDLSHRKLFNQTVKSLNNPTFYHYFPLTMAISRTSEAEWEVDFHWKGGIFVDETEAYFLSAWRDPLSSVHWITNKMERIWIMTQKPPDVGFPNLRAVLYDNNYIYDLQHTAHDTKNLRDNFKRFKREHPDIRYTDAGRKKDALKVVTKWYKTSNREEFGDFGYTLWLTENYDVFQDLEPRWVYDGDRPVAFSLWGRLTEDTAIHIVSKDWGWPFLQDYLRVMTYREMLEEGLTTVNDGSDCGEHGIRMYKLKLRPKYIIPVWSWVKVEK